MQDAFGNEMNYRPLYRIAGDIKRDWKNISPYAKPYVEAMSELSSIHDRYIYDTAQDVVLRFLCNCAAWRGANARRIKQELKDIVRQTGYKL